MQLYVFGINHNTAPLDIREQVAFPAESLVPALHDLVRTHLVGEAAILSTCNRTEIYCGTSAPDGVVPWLARYRSLRQPDIGHYFYRMEQSAVARHACRVAAGLDSMVLGEPQILGQMKQAVRIAAQAGTLRSLLNRLFQQAFSVAKAIRSETEIGANSVSMAAAALRLATSIFGHMRDQSVLFVGAGEMIELCATHFAAQKPKRISVANRTQERAIALADQLGGAVITFSELPDKLAAHDIIITSTASSLPILGKGLVERVIRLRKHRPILMVDLAVPRDIEPEVAQLDDVFLYTIDDLGHIVREGMDSRQMAVSQAEAIIDVSVAGFTQWLQTRELVPTIRQLRDHVERYRQSELERAKRMLAKGEDPHAVLEAMSHGLINKFLHHPTLAIKSSTSEEREELVKALNRLFTIADEA